MILTLIILMMDLFHIIKRQQRSLFLLIPAIKTTLRSLHYALAPLWFDNNKKRGSGINYHHL
ncbi:hypothetical protein LC593_19650 [Nostoc sp. CHAB 5844]|nr:hypothetical protein [Nostoc sp. CHAB 5844]